MVGPGVARWPKADCAFGADWRGDSHRAGVPLGYLRHVCYSLCRRRCAAQRFMFDASRANASLLSLRLSRPVKNCACAVSGAIVALGTLGQRLTGDLGWA